MATQLSAFDRFPAAIRDALTLIPKSVPLSLIAPPLHRFSWRSGVALPPPLMAGFVRNFLYFGITFGVLFGLGMAFMFTALGADPDRLERVLMPAATTSGIAFGLLMALLFKTNARKYRVPTWEQIQKGMPEPPPKN